MDDGYTNFVKRLFAKKCEGPDGFMHAAAGMSGEAGEVLDHVKKHWVYGKPLNHAEMVEELGDQLFYTVALCNLLGVTLDDVIAANVAKLKARYPEGYSDQAAIARVDKQEQAK